MKFLQILIIAAFLATLSARAQNLTATYVELADSADYYISRKMWPEAENVIVKALKHEPANKSNYLLWSNLGIVRENREDYNGAVEAYSVGLSSAPKSTVLLTNRARAFLALNFLDDALSDLDDALAVDSTLQWPLKMRGIILATHGDDDDRALEELKIYTAKYGEDASVLEAEGDIHARKGEFDEMIASYRRANTLGPDQHLLDKLLLTAYVYGKLEDLEEELTSGLKAYPRDGTLYLIRAMLNKSRYQTDAYESDLKTALSLGVNPNLYRQLTGK